PGHALLSRHDALPTAPHWPISSPTRSVVHGSVARAGNGHWTSTVGPRSPRPPQSAMWTRCNIRHNADWRSRMLTVDFDRLAVLPGHRLLDIGAGAGRHAFEAYRRR